MDKSGDTLEAIARGSGYKRLPPGFIITGSGQQVLLAARKNHPDRSNTKLYYHELPSWFFASGVSVTRLLLND